MSVENTNVVDAIGVERDSGKVILTISDHLDWNNEHQHLTVLQDKINTYLRLIESGELDTTYPDARGRARVIDVVTKHEPSSGAREFLRKAGEVLKAAGIELRTRVLPV